MISLASRMAAPSVESSAFDQTLLDVFPAAVCLCDEDGRLLHYNRRAVELWGREPELNSPYERYSGACKLFRPDGTPVPHSESPMAKVLRSGEPVSDLEIVIERPDATRVACLMNVAPVRNALGELAGAINCIQDITERKRVEQVLRDSEDRSRQLLEALPAAVYTTDAAGRITFYNQAAVELSGRRPILGTDTWCVTWRLYWPDGTPMPHGECPMAIALKEDRPVRGMEAIAERPDGTRVAFIPYPTPLHDASGALIGAVNMLVDITGRRNAEQALQQLNETLEERITERTRQVTDTFVQLHESERRFRRLVEGVTDYAIFTLDPTGVVTNWNAGARRIKGYHAEEIIGRHFSLFYTEEDRRNGLPDKALEIAKRTGKYEVEGWRVRKDGTRFWGNVVLDAIRDEMGQLVGFAKITRDLTERRAADEQLRQVQKMEVIGQLTGGVAHDFNNLLTAIIGNLDVLAAILPPQGPAKRYTEAALRAAWRGAGLTEKMLAFSRRQEIRPEIVDLNRLFCHTTMLCEKVVGEGIELVARLQEDLWTCRIDPAQFDAAILNLAANARDAMNRSGHLTITTENVTTGAAGEIDMPTGDYVVFSVGDTGCGMSAEVLRRAFEPFYTTKEVGKGTGLGLSQVYGFAKQWGGAARIESKLGVGTTVRIYIPRVDGEIPEQFSARESLWQAPGGTATILVVEDDADVRDMIIDTLSHLGYQTLVATTGAEALALLQGDNSVELLLSDMVMPGGMGGIDLARAAQRLRPDLKVLLSSGYTGSEAKSHALRAEFPFIAKPYRPAALGHKLSEVLAGPITRPIG